jgi:hypothetical protein
MTNMHPVVLDELVRQHRQELIDDAKAWSRLVRIKRARRRHGDE